MHILLVEDDSKIAQFIQEELEEDGHRVVICQDGKTGAHTALTSQWDMIILDRMLPKLDGLTLLQQIRDQGLATPVLMLTAMDGIQERVDGLSTGADDYLVKPFDIAELRARIYAIVRRSVNTTNKTLLYAQDLVLNRTTQAVSRADQPIILMPREYKILEYMLLHADQLVTKSMLLQHVWHFNFDPQTSLVQTHVSRLRSKIDKPFDSPLIETIKGQGYVIHS
ncbi:response regulator transcription factor [Aestuariibacter sp. AA17]|uniref:Response regulator transcription factor n=1 Tax=Fluctibacter corallii TaxID=2984329 RepID=A0ABT3ABM3_9ALTE|nr:response regulator transcription factor [Aestuariibacter sp. AA17]MCV2885676.1 response regulator transcription factor [Aestuariibacter sp. AA17]